MSWLQVVVLSIVQGLTEFLPVSSSAHLAIVSRFFFGGDAGASFTAVTFIEAISVAVEKAVVPPLVEASTLVPKVPVV